jgi:ketosteroid isomerase-like protein
MQAVLMATPDETEVQFYECLQRAELDRLMSLWADEEDIACVPPGGPRLVGAHAIRAAFEEVRVQTPEGVQSGYVLATNVYVKTPLGWRLVVHHASPGTPRELREFSEAAATLH